MSAITVGGDLVHYEVLGRGRTVILLHGWLGSWRYWIPIMRLLQLRYRVYAIDLFGFGDSSKAPGKYTISQQVFLLDEFMTQLGIPKAAIIGHGLGTMVLSDFVQQYPERVARMMMVSAPLFEIKNLDKRSPMIPDPGADPSHKEKTVPSRGSGPDSYNAATIPSANNRTIGGPDAIDRDRLREAALEQALARGEAIMRGEDSMGRRGPSGPRDESQNPLLPLAKMGLETMLANCFRRSEDHYKTIQPDVSRTDERTLAASIQGFDPGYMLDVLRKTPVPTVIVHGADDPVIPMPTQKVWEYISTNKEDQVLIETMPGVRHFPMMEHEPFMQLIASFLETPNINDIQIKNRWRRRTR